MSLPDSNPVLVATLHDPQGAALPFLQRPDVITALATYPLVIVAATAATDTGVVERLHTLGVAVIPGGPTGLARRAGLAAAAADAETLHVDLDRWLHWQMTWPEELAALPARIAQLKPRPWCVTLGRTARAFATHPMTQRLPEQATNRALSLAAGRQLDAVSGAVWLSPEGAALVREGSIEATASTDLEWAALVLRRDATRLRGLRCEGLEWETPDFHAAAITAAGGLDAWTAATFDTPHMWAARLRLAADSCAALLRVLGEGGEGERG